MSKKIVKSLRALCRDFPNAYAILGWFSQYERHAETMTVDLTERMSTTWSRDNMDEPVTLSRGDVIAVMRDLEEIGVGRFIVGRHNNPSRFEFAGNRSQIGKAAMGEVDQITIEEESEDIEEEELKSIHMSLIANALGLPLSAVKIKIVRP